MEVIKMISKAPASVKDSVIEYQNVRLKSGSMATRVVLSRLLTETEMKKLESNKRIIGFGVAHHRYAPEIQRSYFYVL